MTDLPYVLNIIGASPYAVKMPLFPEMAHERWLSPGKALDIHFDHEPQEVLARARRHFADQPVDVNVVRAANRRKKLLIADMDSTIINVECLDELADMAGLKPVIAAITERAMRGELDFETALRERVAMLRGLELAALERVYDERIRLNPGAKTLLATMRAHGAHALLVSGGFRFFTARVAADAGFHGDQANDLAMIQRAGLGVAYYAKPVVAAAAGAAVRHGDLTALLYLQGYADADFVRV